MKKRNINFVIVGVVAVLLFAALPMIAGESQDHPKNISEWFTTLSEEQREQFKCVVKENLNRYRAAKEKSTDYGLMKGIYGDLEMVLTPHQFAAFQSLSVREPIAIESTGSCSSCYLADYWTEKGVNRLKIARGSYRNSSHPCNPTPYMQTPIGVAINMAIVYGNIAAGDFRDANSTCNLSKAQEGLQNLNAAITFAEIALQKTENWCAPNAPWKDELERAILTFSFNAMNSAQSCIAACGN